MRHLLFALALTACTSTTIVDGSAGAAGAAQADAGAPAAAGAPSDGGVTESSAAGGSGGSAGAAPTEAGAAGATSEIRCDWIPVCAGDPAPCTVAYGSQCGTVRMGTFACGELRGYAFDDGTSYPCDDTGCDAAAVRSATHCSDVSG